MSTCSTCIYFTRAITHETDGGGGRILPLHLGGCACPKFLRGYNVDLPDLRADEVLVEDDEGWGFIVGESFGCIHHQEK